VRGDDVPEENFLRVGDARAGQSTVRTEIPGGSTSSNETEISSPLGVRSLGKSSSRAPSRLRSTQLVGFEAGERTGNTSSSSAVCVVEARMVAWSYTPWTCWCLMTKSRAVAYAYNAAGGWTSLCLRGPELQIDPCAKVLFRLPLVASGQVETGREVWS
jgi:hypothetical protein